MKVNVITLSGVKKRMSVPKPYWTGKKEVDTGVIEYERYRRKDGKIISKRYSCWENIKKPGRCRGVFYLEVLDAHPA